jgi:ADP-ribosylglycohydrolase
MNLITNLITKVKSFFLPDIRLPESASTVDMKTAKQAVIGAILGQAIGDAMGSQTEFHRNDGSENVHDLGNTWNYPYPAFSDDTQNMLAIAEALIKCPPVRGDSNRVFLTEVADNFVRWMDGDPRWGANNRSPGGTCMGGTDNYRRLRDPFKSGIPTGKGNGGAMRASVVGAALWKDPEFAFQIGALTSVPTHLNLESLLASGGVAFLTATSIQRIPFATAVLELAEMMLHYDQYLSFYRESQDANPEWCAGRVVDALRHAKDGWGQMEWKKFNGNDGKGLECLAAAIFYVTRSYNYSDTIIGCTNYTVDSDSTAAVAGAIAGARWGIQGIPTRWVERIEKTEYLADVANRIWDVSQQYLYHSIPAL